MKVYKAHIGWKSFALLVLLLSILHWFFTSIWAIEYWWSLFQNTLFIILSILLNEKRYSIEEEYLIVKTMNIITTKKIEINTIKKIVLLNSNIFERYLLKNSVKIFYNKYDDAFVQTKKINDLINELLKINPQIEVLGLFDNTDVEISNSES